MTIFHLYFFFTDRLVMVEISAQNSNPNPHKKLHVVHRACDYLFFFPVERVLFHL